MQAHTMFEFPSSKGAISECIKLLSRHKGAKHNAPALRKHSGRAAFEIAICFLITQKLMQQQLLVCTICTMTECMTAWAKSSR
jgi:hypothetical protein